jgi:hypothetical protein
VEVALLTVEQVQALKIGDVIYHTIEKTADSKPLPFRVVFFSHHNELPNGKPAPFVSDDEEGRVFMLTPYAYGEFAASPDEVPPDR